MAGGVTVARIDGFRERFERQPEVLLAIVVELRRFKRCGRVRGKRRGVVNLLRLPRSAQRRSVRVERADRTRPSQQRLLLYLPGWANPTARDGISRVR